jgi:hypothetical protein
VSAYAIATGVGVIPVALVVLLVVASVERGQRLSTLAHPVRAVRRMFAEPTYGDGEEDES